MHARSLQTQTEVELEGTILDERLNWQFRLGALDQYKRRIAIREQTLQKREQLFSFCFGFLTAMGLCGLVLATVAFNQ